jgi:hypothetical protein
MLQRQAAAHQLTSFSQYDLGQWNPGHCAACKAGLFLANQQTSSPCVPADDSFLNTMAVAGVAG